MGTESMRTTVAERQANEIYHARVTEGDMGMLCIFCVFALVSSSKWVPLFGSARLLASTFLTFLSGRTTMMGTGEFERQYFDTLPTPGAPNAAPHACIIPRWPLVPTTIESGRYRAINRSRVVVTLPAISSTMMESFRSGSYSIHFS